MCVDVLESWIVVETNALSCFFKKKVLRNAQRLYMKYRSVVQAIPLSFFIRKRYSISIKKWPKGYT